MRLTESIRTLLVVVVLATPSMLSAQKTGAAKPPKEKNELRMPKKATARCADSTWSKAETQQGACSTHGGVAKWFGAAPANMTARCSDGEYWTNAERRGACSQHGGVAFWVKEKKSKGRG